jgi:SAM-dependent methyltransferase
VSTTAEDHRFREAYAAHRAREGRGPLREADLLALPYLKHGPFAREWSVRARSFDTFVRGVLEPLARGGRGAGAAGDAPGAGLRILDLGAGNGWLCHRLARIGHEAVAIDVRTDAVDGLGAAAGYAPHLPRMFGRVASTFERLPFGRATFDVAVFNASLHYALELPEVVAQAARVVRPGGRVVVLDSPHYRSAEAGERMVAEKRAAASRVFGELAPVLGRARFAEYLTDERLAAAGGGLRWRRLRVRYPLWYELRPIVARLRGLREPSRFDVWWAEVGPEIDPEPRA